MAVKKREKSRFWQMRLTSMISISLVLFIVGWTAFLFFMARKMTDQTKENLAVTVIMKEQTDSAQTERLARYFAEAPYVKSFEYISKEAALQEHIANLGENPEEFLGYNPLLAAFELHLNSTDANNESIADIEQRIASFYSVYGVTYPKDVLQILDKNVRRVTFVLSSIAIVLLFISVVLMNNTIRLLVYSKRFIINAMKLVGAKPRYIRRPFIWQSVFTGIGAFALAIILSVAAGYYLQQEIAPVRMFMTKEILLSVVGIMAVFAILITWLSSWFAVNRYIRLKTDALY